MGTVSSKNKKIFGSKIFGYTTSIKASIYIKKEEKQDNLLFKPFLYGLGLIHHSLLLQSSTNIDNNNNNNNNSNRTDSGFLFYEKDLQLWKDLTYIDQTYYNNQEQQQLSETEIIYGQKIPFYFNDISSICSSFNDLNLSKRGFNIINSNISLLTMIKRLDLSFNHLLELPKEIGYLQQLEYLTVSNNQIKFIPNTICYLLNLIELNISNNELQELTPYLFSQLNKLQILNTSHNELKEISIISIKSNLIQLDLSFNPITILPAEITQLPYLRRIKLDNCPLANSIDHFSLITNPISLLEICSRQIIKENQDIIKNELITKELIEYISNYKLCSYCKGPYFDYFISRGRWIDRNDIWIPLEYRLCSAHWKNESDRIYTMFSNYNINHSIKYPSFIQQQQQQQQQQLHELITNENNLNSVVKRWKYKVRNNSNLFLKNHRIL